MIRVLLVDDNAIVRRGVASLLEDDVDVVGEAADGSEAIARAQDLSPDVVCLDVRMPVMDGIEAAAVLSREARVLMLTYAEEEELLGGATRAGASGYLLHGRFTTRRARRADPRRRRGGDRALLGRYADGLRRPAPRSGRDGGARPRRADRA
jgi:DNA-binding NarL/FixJ family response regulator